VRLDLEAGRSSDWHDHVGDELCLVTDGSVDIEILNSGIRTTLRPGDFMHFYAEQRHRAVGVARKSSLFIIRFYQMDEHFIRQKMRREVEKQIQPRGKTPPLQRLTLGWLQQVIESRTVDTPDHVYDKVGLARFLTSLWQQGFLANRDHLGLLQRAHVEGAELHRMEERLKAIEQARAEVSAEELPRLARLYGVEPFLLDNLLYPAIPNAVVVRGGGHPDWRRVGDDPDDSEAAHYVPRRNLAFSDIAVNRLELPPETPGRWNRHPGAELCIPVGHSQATVYFGPPSSPRRIAAADRLSVLHYFSSQWHRIVNEADTPCEVLVIRFFCDGLRAMSSPWTRPEA
jgi:hypothetical protein